MVRGMRLQDRDIRLLGDLGTVVLMTVSMIRARYFPNDTTGEACLRRLRLLRNAGLIARLSFPVVSTTDEPGHLLALYRLTGHGAEVVSVATARRPRRLLRTDPKPKTLLHRRDLAQVMLAVNDATATASLPDPEWLLEQDVRPGTSRKTERAERFILYEDFKQDDGRVLQLRPDASAWLRFPSPAAGQAIVHDFLAWWEIDRSTDSLAQVSDKLPPYSFFLRQHEAADPARRLYRRHWPLVERATLRVFFVCPSVQRMRTISDAIRQLPGAEYVRLATLDSITPERFLRDAIWQDVNGTARAILTNPLPSTKS